MPVLINWGIKLTLLRQNKQVVQICTLMLIVSKNSLYLVIGFRMLAGQTKRWVTHVDA